MLFPISLLQNRLNVETICGNISLVGVGGLTRFGHARGLTPHRGVIQDPRAASLPRRPAKRGIVVTRNGCG